MTTPLKTRILLADDHAVVRKGLRMVLDAEPDLEVVSEAADGSEALDELGLRNALAALAKRVSQHGGIRIESRLDPELPQLDPNAELVVYRVAQESLTNVLRHSGASRAVMALAAQDGDVVLVVSDDGRGREDAAPGNGIKGMKERALGLGGQVEVTASSLGGADVRLRVSARRAEAA